MRKLLLFTIVGATAIISSCGKKVTASFSGASSGSAYHSITKSTQVTKVETNSDQIISAKIEDEKSEVTAIAKEETINKISDIRNNLKNVDKSSLTKKQEKLVNKLDKKLEKLEKKAEKKGGLSKLTKTGIILAVLGLALMILAVIIATGGISYLFWVLGGLALVIGIILVIYDFLNNNL